MDPNETLKNMRRISDRVRDAERCGKSPDQGDLLRMVELAEAMDTWLTTGGFLPKAWER